MKRGASGQFMFIKAEEHLGSYEEQAKSPRKGRQLISTQLLLQATSSSH